MNRKLLVIIALFVITLIVAYGYSGWEFDWGFFLSSFRDVHAGWLLASVVATITTYVLRAIRWQVLLNPLKRLRLNDLLGATLVGFSAIYVLGRAGELVRPVWLTRKERIPLSASVATILVERFLDSLMLVAMFAVTLLLLQLPMESQASTVLALMKDWAWLLLVTSVGVLVALFLLRSNIDRIVDWIPIRRIGALLHNFAQGLSFLQQSRTFGLALVHSVTVWLIIAFQFWFMMLGMGFELTFVDSNLVMVATAIGSIAQIPGIGGGFQAGFVFSMGTFYGVAAEKAIAASLIAWVFSYVPTLVVAAVYMLVTGLSLKDLRGLQTT